MLKRLHVRNFTVFEEAEFEFSPGLNVVVGTNGTGKSHVLKLGYAVESARARVQATSSQITDSSISVFAWAASLSSLSKIFQTDYTGNLIRHGVANGRADVNAGFGAGSTGNLWFEIMPKDEITSQPSSIRINEAGAPLLTTKTITDPVFIPAKEMLTMMPDIVGLSENYDLIDATYTSLAKKLTIRPLSKLPSAAEYAVDVLSKLMKGSIQSENGRFYLYPVDGGRYEISMIAEGFRKLATLAYLLSNGSLAKVNTLFWDEPEANLNPALLREIVSLLVKLVKQGFQIVLATHSVFLLKEIHIQSRREKLGQLAYFGLYTSPNGDTKVETTHDFELLQHISALDAELQQTFDYEEALDQEDAEDSGW